jgi:hypothetical protein
MIPSPVSSVVNVFAFGRRGPWFDPLVELSRLSGVRMSTGAYYCAIINACLQPIRVCGSLWMEQILEDPKIIQNY